MDCNLSADVRRLCESIASAVEGFGDRTTGDDTAEVMARVRRLSAILSAEHRRARGRDHARAHYQDNRRKVKAWRATPRGKLLHLASGLRSDLKKTTDPRRRAEIESRLEEIRAVVNRLRTKETQQCR